MQNGESKSTLLDIFEVAQGEPIQVMQISQKRKSLYVSTDHRIKQIDLAMCSRRYDSCFRCVKDPYCGWDQDTNSCKPYELGFLQVSAIFYFFFISTHNMHWQRGNRICRQKSGKCVYFFFYIFIPHFSLEASVAVHSCTCSNARSKSGNTHTHTCRGMREMKARRDINQKIFPPHVSVIS